MAQGTKVNPWEFVVTKLGIMSFTMPNTKYLAPFVDLLSTLEGATLNESVFLPALKWAYSCDITRLNLRYYVNCLQEYIYHPWASTTPWQTCPLTCSNYWDFTPKWQILSPGGCPDACQLPYSSNTLLLCQRQPAQAPGGHPRQLIMNGQFLLAQRVTSGASDTGSQFKSLSDLNVTLQVVINTLRKVVSGLS